LCDANLNHQAIPTKMYIYAILSLLPVLIHSHPQNWRPILHNGFPSGDDSFLPGYQHAHLAQSAGLASPSASGQCDLYKVQFNQDLYYQYVEYDVKMPELKEFTLCFWNKHVNHSTDHPIFSYAVSDSPRAIYSWVSNSNTASYYHLSIDGHTLYRLNYPLRINRWYHTCQSWNGKTGEWQIWVNAERVGRGFHNRLVGHTIPAGGVAISGIEQGAEDNGLNNKNVQGGMLGEITMLQLYTVALTAGKAHRDHKHHHAHKYDHNGAEITTTTRAPVTTRVPQAQHPLLTGGQLNPGVALNIAAQQPIQVPIQGQPFTTQYVNGQLASPQVSLQLAGNQAQQPQPQNQFQLQIQELSQLSQLANQPQLQQLSQNAQTIPSSSSSGLPPGVTSYSQQSIIFGDKPLLNTGLIHSTSSLSSSQLESHNLFKRDAKKSKDNDAKAKAKPAKRQIIDAFDFDQDLTGLAGITDNGVVLEEQKKMEEREPAEAEVTAVMNICSGCDPEPFAKALLLGWRDVHKKLYSGAAYVQANTQCRVF